MKLHKSPLPRNCARVLFTACLLLATVPIAFADQCPITNAIKWVQYPDRAGLDVLAATPPAGAAGQPLILASDFRCTQTGPITDIHLWASWLGDKPDPTIPITLSFWSDVPATPNSRSRPGSLLWRQTFNRGQYEICALSSADEQFWSPDPPPKGQILGPDHIIWQYNFYPTDPFSQQGSATAPVVYWLSASAGTNRAAFGWKTTTNQMIDASVFGHVAPDGVTAIGDWQPLYDPRNPVTKPLDLAFALTTRRIIPPPPPPPSKWVQYPDTNGFDINASFRNIVADDFLCTNAGLLTNIQIWASWKGDLQPSPNTVFVLGIWDDVPAGSSTSGTANSPSHPGHLLWSETFLPGTYPPAIPAGTGTELFYDPTAGQLSPESKIWRYSFTPRGPFCQKGSPNHPITYWLSVYARNAEGIGWKTSTNHWNDDGVYGHLTATGTAIGDWTELTDPRSLTAVISLDLAFLINNGPPGPDCDPVVRPKWVQLPNTNTTGMDVLANYPNALADDFLCRITQPINGITIWGSWLQDRVDPTANFVLSLWSDIPSNPNSPFSHPGELLCQTVFQPPNAVGTSIQRYKIGTITSNLQEQFYDPNPPPAGQIIGNDTQLWQYDFYPFYPSCWFQNGGNATTAAGLGRVYWLGLTARIIESSGFRFGWKTSTNHWNDDAVYGHYTSAGLPNDWKDLHDPRTKESLDLSFALRAFPITGINKDLRNTTGVPATGIQIVLSGIHVITWHYDDSPAWPTFSEAYIGGNTVLTWTGKSVPNLAISHVGFEMGGSGAPPIIGINWLTGTSVVPARQLCFHFLGNASTIVTHNCLFQGNLTPANAHIEFFDTPPGLDQMIPNGQRTPLASYPISFTPQALAMGAAMPIPVTNPPPPSAMYAMVQMDVLDDTGAMAATDFILIGLDMALRPNIHAADVVGPDLMLRFFSIPDRHYHIQAASDLRGSFFDIFPDVTGTGEEISVPISMGGTQGFYRVVLDPE